MKSEPNFAGKSGFYWWTGVIEDRQDPKKLGRVQVRVLGAHTENKQLIPTAELHWAYVYQHPNNAAMNGIGWSNNGLVEGCWIYGFFLDSGSAQEPVILGVISGIPEEAPNPQTGFYDPGKPFHNTDTAPRKIKSRYYPNDGTGAQIINENTASLYPRVSNPWGCIIGEPDINRLARAENVSDTIIGVQQRQLDVGIKGEFGGIPIAFVHPTPERKWTEPQSAYNAVYPYNHVYESESGHVIEIDDTPGAERIHLAHRTLTRIEIDQEGNLVIKVVGKKFEVTMENSYSHFQNTMNLTVDGECNIYCRSNANLQVDGDLNVHVQGDYTEKVHGNYYTDIDGNRTTKIGGNDDLEVNGNHTTHVGGTSDRESSGPMYDIAGGQVVQSAGSGFMMAATGELTADAAAIFFNSQKGSVQPVTSPVAPVVPTFPSPLNKWTEVVKDSGTDPVSETKSDPNPISPYIETGQQLVVKYDSPTPPTPASPPSPVWPETEP